MSNITDYTGLITSEHNQRPNFVATVSLTVQPIVDALNVLATVSSLLDIDIAVGDQLDKLGEWIGQSRNILIPLPGVFFSWDTSGLGWDQGNWFDPDSNINGLTVLDDASYRVLLKAKIAANHWDGTVPGAYAIWAIVFAAFPFTILIFDHQDMTMSLLMITTGTVPMVIQSLFKNGFLSLRPAGVLIDNTFISAAPAFAWDIESPTLQGWDQGSWATTL